MHRYLIFEQYLGAISWINVLKNTTDIETNNDYVVKNNTSEDITVTDICDKSDIVRRTFYAHFNDKYDLVERIMSDYISDFCRDMSFQRADKF